MFNETYPEQLYDLSSDPQELNNLANHSQYANILQAFRQELHQRWNPELLREKIIASQKQRTLINQAMTMGRHTTWDFQPYVDASLQYMRNHLNLNDLERRARYPAPARMQER